MSWMGKFFGLGGKKTEQIPTPQEAIQKIREIEDLLIKKQEFLEAKINQEIVNAKRHGTKNKRLALQALKRKQQHDQQLNQIDGTLSTLEFQREALENASTNTETFAVIAHAAKSLKRARNNIDVDQVHDLMDDIAEQKQISDEIAQAMSSVGFSQGIDEDDLLTELETLEQEELEKKMLNVGLSPSKKLPDVPNHSLLPQNRVDSTVKPNDDDDELAKLIGWAAT